MKAVFIYNFINYIQWPDTVDTMDIGVLGSSDITQPLREISYAKRTIKPYLAISELEDLASIHNYDIIFIPDPAVGQLSRLKSMLKTAPVLLIGETEGLAQEGVSINFINRDGKMRFEINKESLVRANLAASSQLLKVGIIVEGTD